MEADHPQTVRQVAYQLVTRGVIEKTEGEYQRTVIRLLTEMRLDGQISPGLGLLMKVGARWTRKRSITRYGCTRTYGQILSPFCATRIRCLHRNLVREGGTLGIIWDEASDYDVLGCCQ